MTILRPRHFAIQSSTSHLHFPFLSGDRMTPRALSPRHSPTTLLMPRTSDTQPAIGPHLVSPLHTHTPDFTQKKMFQNDEKYGTMSWRSNSSLPKNCASKPLHRFQPSPDSFRSQINHGCSSETYHLYVFPRGTYRQATQSAAWNWALPNPIRAPRTVSRPQFKNRQGKKAFSRLNFQATHLFSEYGSRYAARCYTHKAQVARTRAFGTSHPPTYQADLNIFFSFPEK